MPFFRYNPSRIKETLEFTLPDPPGALVRLSSFRSFFGFFSGITVLNTPFTYSTAFSLTPMPITPNYCIY